VRVFVDQAVQDGFSADPLDIEVSHGGWGSVVSGIGDMLGNALMRPGAVVVRLVFGQDGAQVGLAEDQHAVEELAAQGADKAFAGRVHPRSLNGAPENPGADSLEDGVERLGEVRSAVADQEPEALEPLAESEGEVAGLLDGPFGGGMGNGTCRARCSRLSW
jgi:hypothetical protein